jgi:hypothetical protein
LKSTLEFRWSDKLSTALIKVFQDLLNLPRKARSFYAKVIVFRGFIARWKYIKCGYRLLRFTELNSGIPYTQADKIATKSLISRLCIDATAMIPTRELN